MRNTCRNSKLDKDLQMYIFEKSKIQPYIYILEWFEKEKEVPTYSIIQDKYKRTEIVESFLDIDIFPLIGVSLFV